MSTVGHNLLPQYTPFLPLVPQIHGTHKQGFHSVPFAHPQAIYALKAAIYELKTMPKGPIHINLSKDVLSSEDFQDFDLCYLCSPLNIKVKD